MSLAVKAGHMDTHGELIRVPGPPTPIEIIECLAALTYNLRLYDDRQQCEIANLQNTHALCDIWQAARVAIPPSIMLSMCMDWLGGAGMASWAYPELAQPLIERNMFDPKILARAAEATLFKDWAMALEERNWKQKENDHACELLRDLGFPFGVATALLDEIGSPSKWLHRQQAQAEQRALDDRCGEAFGSAPRLRM